MPGPARRLLAVAFDGVEMLDLFGPLEMLHDHCDVVLATPGGASVRSQGGPRIQADLALADVRPTPSDILLVPGGPGTRRLVEDTALLGQVARLAPACARVATVCTGAALLARTGLLDGRRATTNKRAFDWVREQGPRVDWQPSARWVPDGPFLTASGVAAGMDMALALLADLEGRAAAEDHARAVEYRWHDDPADDPFAREAA